MEKELRRGRSTLRMLGLGIIVFALWDILKPALAAMLAPAATTEPTGTAEITPFMWLIVALLLAYILLGLPLRFYVGRAARAEGLGKRKGRGLYVFWSFVILALQLFLLVLSLGSFFGEQASKGAVLEQLAALLVEGGSLLTTAQLGFTALKVRRLERQLGEAG